MRLTASVCLALACASAVAQQPVLTGPDAFGRLDTQKPGILRHIAPSDLPEPHSEYPDNHPPVPAPRPPGVLPQAPPGFRVSLYAKGFANARLLRTAPNGDLFLSEPTANTVWVLRGVGPDGKVLVRSKFTTKLNHPFGIAFYPAGPNPQWVYVANAESIVRFPYRSGDLTAASGPQTLVHHLPGFVGPDKAGHWTKDIVFTPDGRHLLISVGAATDGVFERDFKAEKDRADILSFTPEGAPEGVYASGIRNCVGEAIEPHTGELWCSTNERNRLGQDLVPDWISSVPKGSFFGWPFWYIGNHPDPDLADLHPHIDGQIRVPDVLLTAHTASLEMTFYPDALPAPSFPAPYAGSGFAAEHGSTARRARVGYEVVRIPMKDGHATGEYEDFLTGFWLPDGRVWGRPVGVTIGNDGALYVSEDLANTVWRVTWEGQDPQGR